MYTTPVHVTSKNLDILQIKRRVQRLAVSQAGQAGGGSHTPGRKAKKPKSSNDLDSDETSNMALNNRTVSGVTGRALEKELQQMLQLQQGIDSASIAERSQTGGSKTNEYDYDKQIPKHIL